MDKNLIKQVLLEQKEEIAQFTNARLIDREIYIALKNMAKIKLIKVIMGIRRCGKSTLAHQFLKGENYGYINFDDERLPQIKSKDLNDFLEVLNEINPNMDYLLLDEIQNVSGWELFVNRLQRKDYNLIITGSNSKLLSKELSTHLVGRYFPIELFPFSFREFMVYRGLDVRKNDFFIAEKRACIKKMFEEYLYAGGVPEVINLPQKNIYLRELFNKIITRDIVSRHGVKYVNDLKEIALYCVSNCSAKATYHKVRNIFDVKSVHTVKKYLNYLEEAYLVFQLQPFSFKIKEHIKKARKIYCIDNGLISAIVPKTTIDKGRLLENLVFLRLKGLSLEIYYYSQADYEIDFVVKEGRAIKQLIQVCYSLSNDDTKKRELKALIKASDKLKCKNLILITLDEEGTEKIGSKIIKIIPIYKWLMGGKSRDNFG
ncbi:MAG: ATP-binding protein [Elusimicrobia bacterium]|nr:ATP-binding protein [Elusimicrobiota bacterium]